MFHCKTAFRSMLPHQQHHRRPRCRHHNKAATSFHGLTNFHCWLYAMRIYVCVCVHLVLKQHKVHVFLRTTSVWALPKYDVRVSQLQHCVPAPTPHYTALHDKHHRGWYGYFMSAKNIAPPQRSLDSRVSKVLLVTAICEEFFVFFHRFCGGKQRSTLCCGVLQKQALSRETKVDAMLFLSEET